MASNTHSSLFFSHCSLLGCGKSTVVGLLQRFYDPFLGSIRIDGEDLRSLDVKFHRRRIGVVTQNPVLFKGTILSNITYGAPRASLADAVEAARLANALDFINSFPDGFDTDGMSLNLIVHSGLHSFGCSISHTLTCFLFQLASVVFS